ncbi:MAG: hypothetical protein K0U93_21135 [Gammaproteobacteria bacterium]|nr:hypothetical protein [Gammaproteobacteria bacterium]
MPFDSHWIGFVLAMWIAPLVSAAPPLLEQARELHCAADAASAKRALSALGNSPLAEDRRLPNEWQGTHRAPALHAGTLDVLLETLVSTSRRYPELADDVENVLLSWEYCDVYKNGDYYDHVTIDGQLRKQLADGTGRQWRGFQSMGFLQDKTDRYVVKAFERGYAPEVFYQADFHQLYRAQCLPHPHDGRLFAKDSAVSGYPDRLVPEREERKPASYPYTWEQDCTVPYTKAEIAQAKALAEKQRLAEQARELAARRLAEKKKKRKTLNNRAAAALAKKRLTEQRARADGARRVAEARAKAQRIAERMRIADAMHAVKLAERRARAEGARRAADALAKRQRRDRNNRAAAALAEKRTEEQLARAAAAFAKRQRRERNNRAAMALAEARRTEHRARREGARGAAQALVSGDPVPEKMPRVQTTPATESPVRTAANIGPRATLDSPANQGTRPVRPGVRSGPTIEKRADEVVEPQRAEPEALQRRVASEYLAIVAETRRMEAKAARARLAAANRDDEMRRVAIATLKRQLAQVNAAGRRQSRAARAPSPRETKTVSPGISAQAKGSQATKRTPYTASKRVDVGWKRPPGDKPTSDQEPTLASQSGRAAAPSSFTIPNTVPGVVGGEGIVYSPEVRGEAPTTTTADGKPKDYGFSGAFTLSNAGLDGQGFGFTTSVSYKPIRDSYWFVRSALKLSQGDKPFTYSWGIGYDDWHPGTWAFQLNHWGPLEPGDGLDLRNAVASITHKLKWDFLSEHRLSSSITLSKKLSGAPALTWGASWNPVSKWFVRAAVTKPINGDEMSWSYGFGYANYAASSWSLEYNNWGYNRAFEPNFKDNANVSLTYRWRF